MITGNDIVGGSIWSFGAERLTIRGNQVHGLRWGPSLDIVGGSDHEITDNDLFDDMQPMRLTGVSRATVADNRGRGRWWGIHLRGCTKVVVRANTVEHTARAVCVEGGRDNRVEGNRAFRCDTGVLVEQGAVGTVISGNELERCRVGLLLWEQEGSTLTGNVITGSRHHDVVTRDDQP